MKMTNGELIGHINAIGNLGKSTFPAPMSLAIVKNNRRMNEEYKDYEVELNKLNEKFPADDDGNRTQADYIKQLRELLTIEVDVNIQKVPESVLLNSNLDFDVSDIYSIDFMIDEA